MVGVIVLFAIGGFLTIGGIVASLPSNVQQYNLGFILDFVTNPAGMLGVILLAWSFIKLKRIRINNKATK